MNLQKYWSLNIRQADLAYPNHQTFYLLFRSQRDLLIHIPSQKGKTFQTITFIWVDFPQMTRQILTMKTLSMCFNKVNKLWLWENTILPMIYFIKYYCGGFGKIWIRNFIYVIFHIFYHSIFDCRALILRGNITSHSPLTCAVLILGNVANLLPPFDNQNSKPPDPLVLE